MNRKEWERRLDADIDAAIDELRGRDDGVSRALIILLERERTTRRNERATGPWIIHQRL